MLPFLCLLILCGLLTQNVEGSGHPLALAKFSPQLLQHLISQRINRQELEDHLRNLPLEDAVKNGLRKGSGGGGLLSGLPLVGGLLDNVVGGILGLKIKKVSLLELDLKLDEYETKIILTVPADIELELNCPLGLMKRLVHLKLYLDIQVGVRLVKDPYTGHIKLTIENCQNNPGHLRITLLDNANPLIQLLNRIVRLVTDILEKTVPHILQKELCPLLNGLVQTVLDLLQGALTSEMHGEKFQLLAVSSQLHDGSLQIAYEGNVQGNVISPGSALLPSIPLEGGSSMNMVLSSKYLNSVFQALLAPQIFNLGSQNEGSDFSRQIAAWLPQASNIRTVQIHTGAPSLSLTAGKILLRQLIEIRVFTAHGSLFTARVTLVSLAHPSIAGGKLIFTLHSPRIENLSLLNSSIGNIDVQHLTNMISRVLSAYLIPHQNKILAEGITVPLMHNLGLNSLHIAVGKDALLLVVPASNAYDSA